jgi:hypothetical protein
MAKKKYTTIGTMCASKKKNPDDESEKKRFYLKMEQSKDKNGKVYNDKIFPIKLANGKTISDGDMLALFSKKEKFQKLVEEGKMDQAKADMLSSFLLFDIVLVEDVNEGDEPSFDSKEEIPF